MRPSHAALYMPYKDLQGAAVHTAATDRNTAANPLLLMVSVSGFFQDALHNSRDQQLNIPSEGRSHNNFLAL